jgi:hypothetical protein
VLVSSLGISPGPALGRASRYEPYDDEVLKRVGAGEKFAFIFRQDFAFAEWAARGRVGGLTREVWQEACRRAGTSPERIPVGEEFVIFYPLTAPSPFTQALSEAKEAARPTPAAGAERAR